MKEFARQNKNEIELDDQVAKFPIRNHVLCSLRPAAKDFIGSKLHTRSIAAGDIVFEEGDKIDEVVFPHEGVISYMASMEGGRTVEKTSVGVEGYIGFSLLMGSTNAISRSIVQVPGYASWLRRADMEEAAERFECVRSAMLKYATLLIRQLMESVACNSLHTAEQRVARWLLEAHDRMSGDRFAITQQAIADALGLRRATVSQVCSRFQNESLLTYTRGVVDMQHRAALEELSCECYNRIKRPIAPQ